MNKLSRVLLACDFDNTICPTGDALAKGKPLPGVSEGNRAAIERLICAGGHFAVVTGRAFPAYRGIYPLVPTNCPTGLFNGAGIYDYAAGAYVLRRGIPAKALEIYTEVMDAFPTVSVEAFMWDERVYCVRPNFFSIRHQSFTKAPWLEVRHLSEIGELPAKLLFEDDAETLVRVREYICARPWYGEFEAIFSTPYLLEFMSRGANKGDAVLALAAMYGIEREDIYCAGDQENDIAMLEIAQEGFVPADGNPRLFTYPFTRVRPCTEDSIADIIDRLEAKYL